MRVASATVVTMALLGRPRLHLVMRAEDDPRLRQVFDTLSESDQYSVLLQGLLTSPGMYSSDRCTAIVELVGEMSTRRVPLERRALVALLDATLFEPGAHLPARSAELEPQDVPTSSPELLGTAHHLLLNELTRSPATLVDAVLRLAQQASDLDTGTFKVIPPLYLTHIARISPP